MSYTIEDWAERGIDLELVRRALTSLLQPREDGRVSLSDGFLVSCVVGVLPGAVQIKPNRAMRQLGWDAIAEALGIKAEGADFNIVLDLTRAAQPELRFIIVCTLITLGGYTIELLPVSDWDEDGMRTSLGHLWEAVRPSAV